MKIAYLGTGTWGYCLASLLAANGHTLKLWSIEKTSIDLLKNGKPHPNLPGAFPHENMSFTTDLQEAISDVDMICESVSSKGIRPVFTSLKNLEMPAVPLCLTSKGIEKNTGFLLPELVLEILGEDYKNKIACLSGPSHAEEVVQKQPTSVVCAAYNEEVRYFVQEAFNTPFFHVFSGADVKGVAFGGAMKNIIAIACGFSDGRGFGINFKAALLTRGLHEIKKLAKVKGCDPNTLNGLAGMGDLCVTCLSPLSRNYRFGQLLAKGYSFEEAREKVGAVVEGSYCVQAAYEIASTYHIDMPITQMIYRMLYENVSAEKALEELWDRQPADEFS